MGEWEKRKDKIIKLEGEREGGREGRGGKRKGKRGKGGKGKGKERH